jgi:hypothetical protein
MATFLPSCNVRPILGCLTTLILYMNIKAEQVKLATNIDPLRQIGIHRNIQSTGNNEIHKTV